MNIEIYYRYSELDKEHEYSVIAPFNNDISYHNYWTYWFWYYMGALSKGKHRKPKFIPFANTWDTECKIIKVYIETRDAEVCAKRVFNFIKKHYSKQ